MKNICTKIVLFSILPILLIQCTGDIFYDNDETSSEELRYYNTSPAQPVAPLPDPFPTLFPRVADRPAANIPVADAAVEEQAAKEHGFILCHCIFKWLRRDN